jgi:cytochrome c biogenesis protein
MNGQPDALPQQETPHTPVPGVGWEEFSRELVEFFASIKLAMFLFLFIAITATIGTVIQQNERPESYIQEYGENTYRWFLRLGFTDVYHTWWFTSLLGLLCVNSLTCFHKRFPGVWRSMKQDRVGVSLDFVKGMKQQAEVSIASSKEMVSQQLAQYFIEKGYKVLAKSESGEVTIELVKLDTPAVPADKEGSVKLDGEPVGPKMGRIVLRKGHQALLPANSAYRMSATAPSVVLLQTILGDDTIERWAEICLS